MGLDYSIAMIFDKSRTWDVINDMARYATIDFDSPLNTQTGDAGAVMTPYSSTTTARPGPCAGLDSIRFTLFLYFDTDEKLRDYWEPYYLEDAQIREQIDQKHRFGVGNIYMTVYFGAKNVLFALRSATGGMAHLFTVSTSMRNWAIEMLKRFDGIFGSIDQEDAAGILFYKNGNVVEERAWPFSSLGDPDLMLKRNLENPYSIQTEKRLDAEHAAKRPGLRWWLDHLWSKIYSPKSHYVISAVLLFDRSKTFDILYSLNDHIDHAGENRIDMRITDREHFELEEIRFKFNVLFEPDEPIRDWWKERRREWLAGKGPESSLKNIEEIDDRMRTQGRIPVGVLDLELRFGEKFVEFHFWAADYPMSTLFMSSKSIRKFLVGLLDRFEGKAGGIRRLGAKDLLFHINGRELEKPVQTVIMTGDPDRSWQRIQAQYAKR